MIEVCEQGKTDHIIAVEEQHGGCILREENQCKCVGCGRDDGQHSDNMNRSGRSPEFNQVCEERVSN